MSAQQSSSSTSQKTKLFVLDEHAINISRILHTLYTAQLFVDIALTSKTDNFKVHAHRVVLIASSDHFRAMFCSSLQEPKPDEIQLEIDGATLKLVIDFMYSGTIELSCDNVRLILVAAEVLKMNSLKVACSDFLVESIDINNWLSLASMAEQVHVAKLRESAFAFALEHFEEVRQKEDFLQLTEDNLIEIISSDDLSVESEESVFHGVVSWVEFDKTNREKCIANLLTHVRFSFLTIEFIMQNRNSVLKNMESSKVLLGWLDSIMSGKKSPKRHSTWKNANATQTKTLGFVCGGDNLKFQTLNPESNAWSPEDFPPPPTTRTNYNATAIGKKIIIAGGSISGYITNTVWQLDLQTKEWSDLPPMRQARELPGIVELNGDLYVVGGRSNGVWLNSVEKYDFRTREWQELAPMHSKHGRVTVLNGLLYAFGDSGSPIEFYNPANNIWIQIPHKNERSTRFGIAAVGEYLYAVGGLYDGQARKTVERYQPSSETWTVISPGLGIALFNLQCISWNNRLIAYRGYDSENKISSLFDEYNPVTNEWKTLAPLMENDLKCESSSLFIFKK